MFLVNETMVEWVNNEIYKRGFDTSLYHVRDYEEYYWGWIVNVDHELPYLSIEFLNSIVDGTLFVHRNGFILGRNSVFDQIEYHDCEGHMIWPSDEMETFCHIATSDDNAYNWRYGQNRGICYEKQPQDKIVEEHECYDG